MIWPHELEPLSRWYCTLPAAVALGFLLWTLLEYRREQRLSYRLENFSVGNYSTWFLEVCPRALAAGAVMGLAMLGATWLGGRWLGGTPRWLDIGRVYALYTIPVVSIICAASWALWWWGRRGLAWLRTRYRNRKPPDIASLEERGEERALIRALRFDAKERTPRVSPRAARALGRLKSRKAIPKLVRFLSGHRTEMEWAATRALGQIGDPSAVEALVRAVDLKSRFGCDTTKAEEVIDALAAIGGPQAAAGLFELMEGLAGREDLDAVSLRWKAGTALGKMGRVGAERLLQAAGGPHVKNREIAADALRHGELPWAKDELLRLALDSDRKTAARAVQSLSSLGWEPDHSVQGAAVLIERKDWEGVAALGGLAFEPLCVAIEHRWSEVRSEAATLLGRLTDERVVPILCGALSDPDKAVRRAAATGLVALYQGDRLGPDAKRRILSRRSTITTKHFDLPLHTDEAVLLPSDCNTHDDTTGHEDRGIGVDFPD